MGSILSVRLALSFITSSDLIDIKMHMIMSNRMELPSFPTFKRNPFQPNKARKRQKKNRHKGKKSKKQNKPAPLPIIEPIDSEERYQEQQQEALEIVDVASSFDEDGYHYENFEEVEFQYLPTLKQTDMSSFCLSVSSKSVHGFEEELLFEHHGYIKEDASICNLLQGQLLKCKSTKKNEEKFVAIKRVSKELHDKKIIADHSNEYAFAFCTEQNIVKEAQILQYLTDNKSTEYIAKYIDFFESDSDYYLVMEFIEGNVSLAHFVSLAHTYIAEGRLDGKLYQKTIKYIMWQLCAVVHWLHNNMHCCHLDLNLANIMLENALFVENDKDASISLTGDISVKLCGFGVAEVFAVGQHDNFACVKLGSTTGDIQYQCPKMVAEDPYDARKADVWALGMILFECIFGEAIYSKVGGAEGSAYWAVMTSKLNKYILSNYSMQAKFINTKLLLLLNGLLAVDDAQRLNSFEILTSRWFKSYFKRYQGKFEKNAREKSKSLQRNKSKFSKLSDFKAYVY